MCIMKVGNGAWRTLFVTLNENLETGIDGSARSTVSPAFETFTRVSPSEVTGV